jgi:hypothetical protein
MPVGQRRVLFPSDFIQTVQDFVSGFGFDGVFQVAGFLIRLRVVAVNDKVAFHF